MEVTGKRSDLGSLRFSMGTQAGFLWHPRELCYGRAEVTAVGRAGAGCRGHKQDSVPNSAGVPQGGVGQKRMTCLALAIVLVRNLEVSKTVGCVGLES